MGGQPHCAQAAPSSPAVAERPGEHLWECTWEMGLVAVAGGGTRGPDTHTGHPGACTHTHVRAHTHTHTSTYTHMRTRAHTHTCVRAHTHTCTHTHILGAQQLCWNQQLEENKELYMTKDVTSIFFQVDFSLPGGWQLKEERERERVG